MDDLTLDTIQRRLDTLERDSVRLRQGEVTGPLTVDLGSSGVDQGAAVSGDSSSNRIAALVAGKNPPLLLPRQEWLDVRDFAALGDDSTENTAAIQGAIDEAAAAGGGMVLIPEGTFLFDALDLADKVTLAGLGPSSILKVSPPGNGITIAAAVTDAVIRDLAIDGNSPNITSAANCLTVDGTRTRIENCDLYDADFAAILINETAIDTEIVGCRIRAVNAATSSGASAHGIYLLLGSSSVATHNLKVTGCTIRDTGLGCIGGGVDGAEIIGNELSESGATGDAIAIYPSPTSSGRITIVGNVCRNNGNNGMHIGGVAGATIIGNTIENAGARGLAIWSSVWNNNATDQQSQDYVIANNRILTTGNVGLELRMIASAVVSNNIVRDANGASGTGISIAAASGGNDEVIVANNVVRDCNVQGIDVRDSNNVIVHDNVIKDNASRGLVIGGSCDEVRVHDNLITGNTTSQTRVQDTATDVFLYDNDLRGTAPYSNTSSGTVRSRTNVGDEAVTVVAAAALSLPLGHQVIEVTGNTSITSITAATTTAYTNQRVTLVFTGTPTFTDGSNLKLAGNFVAAGSTNDNDTITIASNGTNWYECSRSTN